MNIQELQQIQKLSVRTINICRDNGLTNLVNLKLFRAKNGGFLKIRNCGKLSNDELEKICETYCDFENQFIQDFLSNEYHLSDLIKVRLAKLSLKYRNVVRSYLNYDISAANVFIKLISDEEFDILRVVNFGSNGKIEIESFIIDVNNLINGLLNNIRGEVNNERMLQTSTLSALISNLNRAQRGIINSYIEVEINNLSVRGRNGISAFLGGDLKIRNFNEKILSNETFNLDKIKNIGSKSLPELGSFIKQLKMLVEKVSRINDTQEFVKLNFKITLEKHFSDIKIPNDVLESQSIFRVVDYLIYNEGIFEKNEKQVFKDAFKIYEGRSELSLEHIADKIHITRERVRQIRKRILSMIFEKFSFLNKLEDDLYQKYGLDSNQAFIRFDSDTNNTLNRLNKTNFTTEFNTFLTYIYLSDSFDLVGEIEDVLQNNFFNSRGRHNWRSLYLVRKEITEKFNFQNFANEINRRINSRINESYRLNFKSFLSDYCYDQDHLIISTVEPIAEIILNQEFNLTLSLQEELVFNRNTIKQVSEYAIEALEELGVPSKVEDIFNLISIKNSDVTKSPESLRGSLQGNTEFIYFGRSSTYGLKKWEVEKEGVKGGTIKDMIYSYLLDKSEPIHILELLEEVHKYREKTTAKNILTNLKLDSQKQYLIFNQSFVGLRSKNYESELTCLPKFLGKRIVVQIGKMQNPNRITVEGYFANKLNLTMQNMKLIIDNLIHQGFISIDDNSNLKV